MTRKAHVGWLRVLALSLVSVLAIVLLAPSSMLAQEEKSFHWERYDYDIDILPNGDMLFAVTMTFSFDQGSFSQGYYAFSMDRVVDVRDVELLEGSQPYRLVSGESVGGYQVEKGKLFSVVWWFPPSQNQARTFLLRFRVIGGLRIYDGGDQFYWNFYAGDRAGAISQGRIRVRLPAEVDPESLRLAVQPASAIVSRPDARTVEASVADLPPNEAVVLRVQFPHGLVQAEPPPWQLAEDRRLQFEESWKPVLELLLLGFSALLLFGGVGAAVALWYTRGRDKPVGLVAEYLSEPPSELAPGLAGALLDEKVDVRDILATIVDLGRRGVLEIHEVEEKGPFGLGQRKDFIYRKLDAQVPLRPFEEAILQALLGGSREVRLSALKERFYEAIPRLAGKMYEELTALGFFAGNPQKTRNRWRAVGVAGFVLSFVLLVVAAQLAEYAATGFCVPIALGATALAFTGVAGFMPRKTEKGAEEAAKWKAFRTYLADIDRFENLIEKKEIFERYLPYAIAFGLERGYITQFAQVQAPAPRWYYPYPPVVWGHMGRVPGSEAGAPTGGRVSAPGAGKGVPSLQGMSDGLASSLQNMSDSLITMLNSASRTLTSQPSSSGGRSSGWSGGGGGMSRGGGGGGGSGAR